MSRKYKLVLEDTSPSEMKRFEVWMVGVIKETYEHKKNETLLNQYAKSLNTTNSGTKFIPVLEVIRAISKLEFKNHKTLTIEDLMKYEKSIFTNYSPDSSCVVNYTDSQGIKKDGAIVLEWKPFTGLNLEDGKFDIDIKFEKFHTSFELYIYNSDLSEIVFSFKVGNFDLWLHLLKLLNIVYTKIFEQRITEKYFTKISTAYTEPNELDAVYEGGIPKFVDICDEDLYNNLDSILDSMIFSSSLSNFLAGIGNTNDEKAVLNILYAIKDRKVLYEKLKNTGLLKRIYDKLHADNIDDLIRFLTRLVEENDQSKPTNTVYFENSYYLFRNVHLKTEWSDKDIIINNYKDKHELQGKARTSISAKELDRMYPPGVTKVPVPEKYIPNVSFNPLEKLNFGTKFDDGDFVGDDGTFVLAIKLHKMASRQSNWDLFNVATDLLSLLSGVGMLRVIATKGVSLSAKAIASAVLIKDMTHYAMLSNKTLENWHSNGYGWLAKIWMGFSVGIDLLSLSLYDLSNLSRHGKAAAELAETEKETAEINKIVQKANLLVEAEIGEDVTKMTPREFKKVVEKIENTIKNEVKFIETTYGESKMSKLAIEFRKTLSVPMHGGNVAIFKYIDNNGIEKYKAFTTLDGIRTHAEMLGVKWLKENKIPFNNVKKIYSELEPCTLGQSNCKNELTKIFPKIEIEYSYKYKGTGDLSDTPEIIKSRNNSRSQRTEDLNKFIKE